MPSARLIFRPSRCGISATTELIDLKLCPASQRLLMRLYFSTPKRALFIFNNFHNITGNSLYCKAFLHLFSQKQ